MLKITLITIFVIILMPSRGDCQEVNKSFSKDCQTIEIDQYNLERNQKLKNRYKKLHLEYLLWGSLSFSGFGGGMIGGLYLHQKDKKFQPISNFLYISSGSFLITSIVLLITSSKYFRKYKKTLSYTGFYFVCDF